MLKKELVFSGRITQVKLNDNHLMVKPFHFPEMLFQPYDAVIKNTCGDSVMLTTSACFSFKSPEPVKCKLEKEIIKCKGRTDSTVYYITIDID